jgi:hypothetical protein
MPRKNYPSKGILQRHTAERQALAEAAENLELVLHQEWADRQATDCDEESDTNQPE